MTSGKKATVTSNDLPVVAPTALSNIQAEAWALHRRARSGEALAVLDRSPTTDDATSLLLRGRLSLALSRPGAIAILRDQRFAGNTMRSQAEAAMLLGCAHTAIREYETAESCFAAAHIHLEASSEPDDELFREIELSLGTMLIAQGRIDDAERTANALARQEKPSSHAAATFFFLSQIAWHREEMHKNAAYLLQALTSISADPKPDVKLWAQALVRLAVVFQFVPSPAVRKVVIQHATDLPWTEELANSHSQCYRLLGTRAVVDGAISEGFAFLKRAANTPGASLTHRISAILTHADVSKSLGEPYSCEEHLLDATTLAQQVDWRTAPLNTREILIQLAEMHAHRDNALALSFAAQFESLGGFGIRGRGRDAIAQQNFCLGVLYAEIGETSKGVGMLEEAYAGFAAVGYDWPAGLAAIVLAETTSSVVWRSRARESLARYPNSYLSKRLTRLGRMDGSAMRTDPNHLTEDPKLKSLTRAQRTVYYRLLEGVSVKEIAADLKRSDHTVRNHIQAIFGKFGVNSRADLVHGVSKPPAV